MPSCTVTKTMTVHTVTTV